MLYGTSHFKAPVSGRSGKVPLSADKWSLRRDVTGFWRLFFSLKDCAWYNVYTFTHKVFSFLSYDIFFCSSNFGIIYQRIYIRATKHEWLLTNWSKHVFTIQIWIYSVLICLRRMRRRRRRINKDCIYVMEGWVYIEREKEICLDSRPTCTMILQSLKKIII